MENEMMFDPFEGGVICNCKETRPEVIGRLIPSTFSDEEEFYTCRWCKFIRAFGMVDKLERIEEKIVGISSSGEEDDYYSESDEERFAYDTLEDLEDWGAFSDEGIMPGCHSNYDYEFGESFFREYEEYYKMRRFYGAIITFARESLNLSIKELAEHLELPEYVIENLESGEESLTYDRSEPMDFIGVATPLTSEEIERYEREKKWWQGKSDGDIEEGIHTFLLVQKKEYEKKNEKKNC